MRKLHVLIQFGILDRHNGNIGLQTAVPPSIHPSGERIRFEADGCGSPGHIDARDLVKAAGKCSAAVLLAWNFPPSKGGRHDAFLALAGYLLRHCWAVAD